MPASNRPNILIIQADQHRADCIGAYGNTDIQTPHIDALAADGVRYDNSFCPYPVCTPSRYSFLSGLYVRQHLGGSNRATLPAGLTRNGALIPPSEANALNIRLGDMLAWAQPGPVST